MHRKKKRCGIAINNDWVDNTPKAQEEDTMWYSHQQWLGWLNSQGTGIRGDVVLPSTMIGSKTPPRHRKKKRCGIAINNDWVDNIPKAPEEEAMWYNHQQWLGWLHSKGTGRRGDVVLPSTMIGLTTHPRHRKKRRCGIAISNDWVDYTPKAPEEEAMWYCHQQWLGWQHSQGTREEAMWYSHQQWFGWQHSQGTGRRSMWYYNQQWLGWQHSQGTVRRSDVV